MRNLKGRYVGVAVCALTAVALSSSLRAGESPRKHLIGYGWDMISATTEDVFRNRAKFAATGFDGVILQVVGRQADGKACSSKELMNDTSVWTDASFGTTRQQLAQLTRCNGLRHSLGLVLMTPKARIAWTDDASWTRMCGNVGVLARTLKAGGLEGVALDHEDYSKTRQFRRLKTDPDFPQLTAIARLRGRQFFKPLFAELPKARVLAFWMFSEAGSLGGGDLWSAFLNGMLDVMPETARMIDGNEDSGYFSDARKGDFQRGAHDCIRTVRTFVNPENRRKYDAVCSASFGQYLDMYINEKGKGQYYFGPLEGGTRVDRLEENMTDAVRFCDDIVWVYGEKGTLVDWDRKRDHLARPTWESQLPGLAKALRIAAGDGAALLADIASGAVTNLIRNAACNGDGGKALPREYWFDSATGWPPEGNVVQTDEDGCTKPGCLKLFGTGSIYQTVDGLKPGETVYMRVAVKGKDAFVSRIWMKDKTNLYRQDRCWVRPEGRNLGGGWREVFLRCVVPENANKFFFALGGNASPASPILFDDVAAYVRARK